MSRTEYAFESRKLTQEEVRGLLYREILEYHPQAKREFAGGERASNFMYASSGVGADFAAAEEAANGNGAKRELRRSAQSLPKESVENYRAEAESYLTGGVGALKRSESIQAKTPTRPVSQSEVDEMMDAAESMSLDDKELEAAAQQARAMMQANMQSA